MAVSVLLNRGGGALAADPNLPKRVEKALKSAGLDIDIELLSGGDCEVRARAVAERGDELLVVGGGDGTISAAASALVGTKTKLGVLPLGTLNHFARDLGIPTDLDEAARLIASNRDRRVDVAEMNDHLFINNSAIGLYPLMVRDRELQQKKLGRASGSLWSSHRCAPCSASITSG
jgi:diacylglycerol kinase family enzyme